MKGSELDEISLKMDENFGNNKLDSNPKINIKKKI